jgi:hypothetical protein
MSTTQRVQQIIDTQCARAGGCLPIAAAELREWIAQLARAAYVAGVADEAAGRVEHDIPFEEILADAPWRRRAETQALAGCLGDPEGFGGSDY